MAVPVAAGHAWLAWRRGGSWHPALSYAVALGWPLSNQIITGCMTQ